MRAVPFDQLDKTDLNVDGVYLGGRSGNAGDDPFPRLLKLSNQGGFRYRGTLSELELVATTSSMSDQDWPDDLDKDTGVFTYYGDNKTPGRELHETPRNGNELLRRLFEWADAGEAGRLRVPPVLVFANLGQWRDVVFLGLAVPGTSAQSISEDLVAIWKSAGGRRFQNYRARLTVLDIPVLSRAWINDILSGKPLTANAPQAWLAWIKGGAPRALISNRSVAYRTKAEQLPKGGDDLRLLQTIRNFFAERPHDFEACAAAIARLLLPDVTTLDLTRPSRDGGRDGIGDLRIGRGETSISVRFALEAKCYDPENSVGVREVARLISRLRHREFGVLVTTSYVHVQAYREIKEDAHPIIVVSGADIVSLLRTHGLGTQDALRAWLQDFSGSTR